MPPAYSLGLRCVGCAFLALTLEVDLRSSQVRNNLLGTADSAPTEAGRSTSSHRILRGRLVLGLLRRLRRQGLMYNLSLEGRRSAA
jgi:hypothetical protein